MIDGRVARHSTWCFEESSILALGYVGEDVRTGSIHLKDGVDKFLDEV